MRTGMTIADGIERLGFTLPELRDGLPSSSNLPCMRGLASVSASLLLTALAAGCGGNHTAVRTVTVTRNVPAAVSATGDQRVYGQIRSLKRTGNHYELRLDPAWHL